MLSIPPELKKITPFVRRAEELDKDKSSPASRLVAYYCRQYAVHTGIPLATSPTGKACLGELLSNLETEKTAMDNFTREEAKFLCRQFADKIFEKADSEDRAGTANKDTAKTFYAAASFMEVLQQFYADDDASEDREEEKKRVVYAKWKATVILKALKAGEKPPVGGYGEENAAGPPEQEDAGEKPSPETQTDNTSTTPLVETVETSDDGSDEKKDESQPEPFVRLPEMDDDEETEGGTEVQLGPPPAYPGDGVSSNVVNHQPPPPLPPPTPAKMEESFPTVPSTKPPSPKASKKTGSSFFGLGKKKKNVSKADIADAMELTKFALAALEEKDVDVASDRLKRALQALGR